MTRSEISTPQTFPLNSTPLWLPAFSLTRRECIRFLRQPHRIIGALATPVVFWLLIGFGMGRSFQGDSSSSGYIEYFFPGTVVMILLFTAVFSTISIIEDRREGFLQSVLVAPISPMVIVLGKVMGGTALAFGQGLVFLLLAPLIGMKFSAASFLLASAAMLLMSFSLTALGFCIAWRMSSTQGFHAIMNLFLMPLWFLSGAMFPADKAGLGLKWVIRCNPLSYGLSALRDALTGGISWGEMTNFAVSAAFAGVMFAAASWLAKTRTAADWSA